MTTTGISTNRDEQEIRVAVEDWIAAIVGCDLDGVVAAHTDDIVMFDVPPPERGRRGIDDYRASWPPFFDWIRSGANFELVELHVEAGADLGFAWALLKCGTDDDLREQPDRRLRLTLGFRRVAGSWQIAHEHHSFTQ